MLLTHDNTITALTYLLAQAPRRERRPKDESSADRQPPFRMLLIWSALTGLSFVEHPASVAPAKRQARATSALDKTLFIASS